MKQEEKIKSAFKKLNTAHSKYQSAIGSLEAEISTAFDFDFSIIYQNSDGFVIEHNSYNAPLSECLGIIIKKGILTEEEFFNISI